MTHWNDETPAGDQNNAVSPSAENGDPAQSERQRLTKLGVQAWRTYWRDRPDLLRHHYRQWVAYSGDRQIGFGRSDYEVYQLCFHQGLRRGEFIAFFIDDETDEIVLPELPSP